MSDDAAPKPLPLVFEAPKGRGKPPRHLADLSMDERLELAKEAGLPAFRARQLSAHYFQRLVDDPEQMTDLPAGQRDELVSTFLPELMTPLRTLEADKGTTRKTLWKLFDGALVESVLMRYPDRVTMCVSSQAGCGMACPFCATGQGGLQRNMSTAEIVEQVVAGARSLDRGEVPGGPGRVSNVVFMGMGEPMANYKAVIGAVRRLTDPAPDGLGMSARGVTVSTVGLVPRINQLADEGIPVTLALSLHAPDDELRNELVPINTRSSVAETVARRQGLRRQDPPSGLDRVRHDARHQRPGLARGPARRRPPRGRHLGLGARQPDPAQPHPGLEVDRVRPRRRARVRTPARGPRHPDHGSRHPRPRDRRCLRPARRDRELSSPTHRVHVPLRGCWPPVAASCLPSRT